MFIKKTRLLFSVIAFAVMTFLLSENSNAARVLQVKNGKALIDVETDSLAPNQDFYLVNGAGKKTALVRILQVKPGKAVASILKGNATGGETLLAKSGGATTTTTTTMTNPTSSTTSISANSRTSGESGSYSASPDYSTGYGGKKKISSKAKNSKVRVSALLNMMMNNMAVVTNDLSGQQETVAMKGSSFGLTGAIDYPMWPSLTLRGTVGYEPFVTQGTSSIFSCANQTSQECNANITYIAFGGYLRYDIIKDPGMLWIAGGGTMRMPMGKSSTALNESEIAMTATYGIAAGYDIFINNNKSFIPISFEMQFFMPSDTVKADFMSFRAGYGFVF